MSNSTLNMLASDERVRIKNVEPTTGLARIPQFNEQHVRPLDLVEDGAFNGGIRAFYRQLGSFRSQDGKSLRTLGLTSCYQHEGKSTIGVYLASVAAESRRVLFIDSNQSRLAIYKAMRDIVLNGVPLTNDGAISAQTRQQSPARASSPEGDNGQPTIDETRDLLRLVSSKFDFVVVDLPPLDSASVLDWAPLLDGIVLVVESERVRWQVAARGIDLLEQAGSQVLGTVINKQREYIPHWLYQRL
jgi:protein-tyrosine kinase